MMVVGGRAHTGSFDKEMSKCVSLCVSVRVCDAVWLTETRELMSWVCACFWCTVWPVVLAAGLALWPQSPGDQGVDVWGWMVSSITSLSHSTTDTEDGGGSQDLTICEATTVSVGACSILRMALTSLCTSACRVSMKTYLFACWMLYCCLKKRASSSTRDKARSLITLFMLVLV